MANKTTNFNLDLPTGDELFNPLWPNSNTTKIDAQMKKNMDNSVTKADCVFNTNKFIITREDKTGKIFKFIAPHDFVAGYTFTVDGTAMDGIVAGTGDALADGCFMNGHEVIAYIDETTASLAFLVGSSLPDAIDATTLEGHGADYFATAAGLAATNQVATSAGQVANQALEAAQKAGMKTVVVRNGVAQVFSGQVYTFTNVPDDVKFFVVTLNGGTAIVDVNQLGNTFMIEFAESITNGTRTKGVICAVTKTDITFFNCRELVVTNNTANYSTPSQFNAITLTVTAVY